MISYTLPKSGSSRGLSYWLSYFGCPRKVDLTEQWQDKELFTTMSDAQAVGVFFHAFMELYHKGIGNLEELVQCRFMPTEHPIWTSPTAKEEAIRLLRWWDSQYGPDVFGQTLYCELDLKVPAEILSPWHISDLTGRLDMVSDLSFQHSEFINRRFKLSCEPGIYIIDHKTRGRSGSSDSYVGGLQSILYPLLWDLNNPGRPCKGTLFSLVTKTREVQHEVVFAPCPSPQAVESLFRTVARAVAISQEQPSWANISYCFKDQHPYYQRPCYFLSRGICNRI